MILFNSKVEKPPQKVFTSPPQKFHMMQQIFTVEELSVIIWQADLSLFYHCVNPRFVFSVSSSVKIFHDSLWPQKLLLSFTASWKEERRSLSPPVCWVKSCGPKCPKAFREVAIIFFPLHHFLSFTAHWNALVREEEEVNMCLYPLYNIPFMWSEQASVEDTCDHTNGEHVSQ